MKFPNEGKIYRAARNKLLAAEIALRRKVEAVAALRRKLPKGGQWPMMNVFVRRDGAIRHFWGSEMLAARSDPGQNGRHVDLLWPLWNALDITPEGRGKDWYPKLDYAD